MNEEVYFINLPRDGRWYVESPLKAYFHNTKLQSNIFTHSLTSAIQ